MNFPDRSFQLVEQHAGHEQCHSVAPDFCGVFLLWLRNRIWKKVKQGSSASGQSKHVRLTRATTVETLSVVVVFQNFRFVFFLRAKRFQSFIHLLSLFNGAQRPYSVWPMCIGEPFEENPVFASWKLQADYRPCCQWVSGPSICLSRILD